MSDDPNKLDFKLGPLSINASGRTAIFAMLTLFAMAATGRVWGYW